MALALPASITDILPVLQALSPAQKQQVIDAIKQTNETDTVKSANEAWQRYLDNRDSSGIPSDFMADREQNIPQKRDLF